MGFKSIQTEERLSRSIIRSRISSKIKRTASLVYKLPKIFSRTKVLPEIQHLPFSITSAIRQVIINREVNEKIQKGYFEKHFIIVAALQKSASSVLSTCVAQIIGKARGYGRYMVPNQDSDLRVEIVQDFPDGGVVRSNPQPSGKNFRAMEVLGAKYILLLRHPADHVAAIYCSYLSSKLLKEAVQNKSLVFSHMHPLPYGIFQPGVSAHETLRYMIKEGYLNAVLEWMVDWLRFRKSDKSILLTYEDFMLKRDKVWDEISHFLHGKNASGDLKLECNAIADGYKTRRLSGKSKTKREHPHGWTGKIGVWKQYFSDENKKDYISVVKAFLSYYPKASLLLDVYPNLLNPTQDTNTQE